jgi:hypothetical protein
MNVPRARRESKIGQVRAAAASLNPLDYVATVALVAVYAVGTSPDEGPGTSMDFYRSAATVIPTLLVAVAIQGRLLELSLKITFPRRYRTVMLAVVVFGGEAWWRQPQGPLLSIPLAVDAPEASGRTGSDALWRPNGQGQMTEIRRLSSALL